MDFGWIKLHRNLKDWEWYDDHNCVRLLIHLLLTVNHKEKRWQGIKIMEGQRIASWDKLSTETGLTLQQVRTAIKKLELSGEITRKLTGKSQLVTLVKWGKMQDNQQEDNREISSFSTENQQNDNRTITDEQQQLKNVKNNKNVKNKDIYEKSKRFSKPTIEQIKIYCEERKNNIDAEKFYNHYEANGWMRGGNKIKNWQACIVTWEKNEKNGFKKHSGTNSAGKERQEFESPYA